MQASATLPKVLVVASASASYKSDVVSKISATGLYASVDLFDAGIGTPTVSQMGLYEHLFVFSDSGFNNSVALGNNLADYLDAGGGVVVATFSVGSAPLGGRIVSGGYLPYNSGGQNQGTRLYLVPDLPGHALLSGVASLDGGSSSFHGTVSLAAGATLVAHWTNNMPLVMFKKVAARPVVALNFYPPSSDARSDFWVASTGGVRLMTNALAYTIQAASPPDIALEAPTGTAVSNGTGTLAFAQVAPGQTQDITCTLRNTGGSDLTGITAAITGTDAARFSLFSSPPTSLAAGGSANFTMRFSPTSYGAKTATLSIASNDPDENPFTLALTGYGNTAPTFAGYSVATPWQTAATISLGKLLTKAADADGDVLSVTAAGPASAQGGTAVLQSGSILYTPPNGFSGTDTFSVTLADVHGASVSGTVTVSVGPNPTSGGQGVNPPQITMLGNGDAEIASQGIPGRTYLVQRSTNLSSWATIGAVIAASNGVVSFIDENPPPGSAFYRLGRNVPVMNFWGNGSDGALNTTGNTSFASIQDGDVVVKQFSNLTINAGHTVTTATRCRGLVIYVDGDCTINGTLSMTARGANANPTLANSIPATGIRLARFKYGSNETLAASDLGGTGAGGVGAAWRAAEAGQLGVEGNGRIFVIAREGGAAGSANHSFDWWNSVPGGAGGTNPNGTGGGGGGGAAGGWSGSGSAGTCYSGGSGGGAVRTNGYATAAGNAAAYGGAGGYGNWTSPHDQGGGGAGNPGGSGIQPGQSGTGGLLILMVKGNLTIGATGQVVSRGSNGGSAYQSGGGSGGGRILLLHAGNYSAAVAPSAAGGSGSGAGGAGAITIERIDP